MSTTTIPHLQTTTRVDGPLLRLSLQLDAAVTGLNGVAYLAAAGLLDGALGLPAGLLRGLGAFLVAYAALVAITGTRASVSRPAVLAIIMVNAVWAVDSVVALTLGWWSPTVIGGVWIAVQAATVAGFAALQAAGLRRAR